MLDRKDRAIVTLLRTNARMKLTDISEHTGIPVSTVHERMEKLMEKVRMVTIPDYGRMHMPLVLWAIIRTEDRDSMRAILRDVLHINTLLETTNGADFVCECVFPGFAEQHAFASVVQENGTVQFYPLLEVIGKELATI